MNNIQLSLFETFVTVYENEKKEEGKKKPETAEVDFKFCFLVNSSHVQHWRGCDIKTAQRRLSKIRKDMKLKKGAWLTFAQVADYEGWNRQILLDEMQTRRYRLKEQHREKI